MLEFWQAAIPVSTCLQYRMNAGRISFTKFGDLSKHVLFNACHPCLNRIGRTCRTAEDFLSVVGEALRQLYGLAGGAMAIEVVQFDGATNHAIISVAKECDRV